MADHAADFAGHWSHRHLAKGAHLAQQDEPEPFEHILLDGRVAGQILDPKGRAICVGLYAGPCTITPNVARTSGGVSRVSLMAQTDALEARMPSALLSDLMLTDRPIRDWANGVLRDALAQKADREWCLAALGGAQRLAWFRQTYPGHEDLFGHTLIASFLGMTPVTLSRLRNSRA